MKIVVVTGSPRKFGNSFSMTEAFIKEAEQCGHSVKWKNRSMLLHQTS